MDFIIKTFRILFFMLDEVVYGLIDDFYALLLQLCRTSIFTQDVISEFAKRVYALVGIFMLFKVTLSIITYILNPDDFSDKEKGFTSIIKHVILSLVLVVITPYIFSEAYDLQTIILEDNTIMNVVFGTPAEAHMPNTSYVESAGNKIQFTIMYAFAQPNIDDFYTDSNTNLASCATTYKKDSNGNYEFRALPKYDIEVASACEAGKSCFIYELNPDCFGSYNADNDTYENGPLYNAFNEYESENSIAGSTVYQNYAQGVAQQSFNMFFRKDVILATVDTDGTKRYIIDYKFGISTAVGIGVLYLLLLFCIDIAVRSVKLGFLQMIAPIPIISYCDPKSKKDGMFSKWLKMCTSTYLELFFRLFALYFGIYVISLIGTFKDVITNQKVDGFFVSVFMIIGILIFVKQLPKILEDSLGIKGAGNFQLNALKKLENDMLGGKYAAAGIRRGRNAIGGAAVAGITGAGFAGMGKAFTGGLKGDKFSKQLMDARAAKHNRKANLLKMKDDGVNDFDILGEKWYQARHGGLTRSEHATNVSNAMKSIQDDYANYEKTAAGVDAIAKDFDKRKKAAEAAGDYAEAKRWSTAFDARVKEIAKNHGKVVGKTSIADLSTTVDADGNIIAGTDYYGTAVGGTVEVNAALRNTQDHMDSVAAAMNSQGSDVAGYQVINASTASDIKAVKNQAQASQQSIDTNAANKKNADVAKYVNQKK